MNAPRFKELSVSLIYDMVKEVPSIQKYLPKDLGERLPRKFLFDVSV